MLSNKNKIGLLIKYCDKKKVVMKNCLQNSPTNIGHTQLRSVCSGRSTTPERSTDKFTWQWKKTKSYLKKIKYNFNNILLILCVKYFIIG